MSKPTHYKKGDWNAICDACGQRYPASALRKRWDGLMVCKKDYEVRHPQEFVRARADNQTVPWTRPESTDYNFRSDYCIYGIGAVVGVCTVGCAIVGRDSWVDHSNLFMDDPNRTGIVGVGIVGFARVGRGISLNPNI